MVIDEFQNQNKWELPINKFHLPQLVSILQQCPDIKLAVTDTRNALSAVMPLLLTQTLDLVVVAGDNQVSLGWSCNRWKLTPDSVDAINAFVRNITL